MRIEIEGSSATAVTTDQSRQPITAWPAEPADYRAMALQHSLDVLIEEVRCLQQLVRGQR